MKRFTHTAGAVCLAAAGLGLALPGQALASTLTNLQVVNLFDTTATIAFDSAAVETATVSYGASCTSLTTTTPADTATQAHAITLINLTARATYFYTVTSGGTTSACQSFTTHATSPTLRTPPSAAVGRVFSGSGCNTVVTSGIVTVVVTTPGTPTTVDTLPNESSINGNASGNPGTYTVNFSPAAAPQGSGYYVAAGGETITVTADTGTQRGSAAIANYDGSTPLFFPNICVSNSPTAVAYSRLQVHQVHGITELRWYGTQRVLGYNVYDGGTRLNRALVTSHTHWYHFATSHHITHLRLTAVTAHSR